MDGKLQTIETTLVDVNKIISQINPLIGVVGSMATLLVHVARKAGADPAEFEAEMAAWEANRAALRSALDEFKAKYPTTENPASGPA